MHRRREILFTADEFDKFKRYFLSIKILIKIQARGLLLAASDLGFYKHGTNADIGNSRKALTADAEPGGVDTKGGQETLRPDRQVGGRNAQRTPAPVAMNDFTGNRIIAAQQAGGFTDSPGAQCMVRIRLEKWFHHFPYWINDLNFKTERFANLTQARNISFAIAPECKIRSYPQPAQTQVVESICMKSFAETAANSGDERQRDQVVDAQFCQQFGSFFWSWSGNRDRIYCAGQQQDGEKR
jgi:hypothetical protein